MRHGDLCVNASVYVTCRHDAQTCEFVSVQQVIQAWKKWMRQQKRLLFGFNVWNSRDGDDVVKASAHRGEAAHWVCGVHFADTVPEWKDGSLLWMQSAVVRDWVTPDSPSGSPRPNGSGSHAWAHILNAIRGLRGLLQWEELGSLTMWSFHQTKFCTLEEL